jgi:uncharacterized protein YueI
LAFSTYRGTHAHRILVSLDEMASLEQEGHALRTQGLSDAES